MRCRVPRILSSGCVALLVAATATAGDVYLGISMSDLSTGMARALELDPGAGVLVDEVMDGSPAAEAGLEAGDVILAIAGEEIDGIDALVGALRVRSPGDEITTTVQRDGERRELDVTLGERGQKSWRLTRDGKAPRSGSWFETDEDADGNTVLRWGGQDGEQEVVIGGFDWLGSGRGYLGIVPGDLDRDELRDRGAFDGRGVVVDDVVGDGPAADAGIEAGDVIVAIDDVEVGDRSELHETLAATEAGQTVTVRVIRDGKAREFTVELAASRRAADLARSLERFLPDDPHAPRPPRFSLHGLPPDVERERLEQEREELAELRDQLAELKDELRKLRQELARQR